MSDLIHTIYASAASVDFDEMSLEVLLKRARTANAEAGITGMLLYSEGSFFQVLEGEAATVEEVFESIARDERHKRVAMIIKEPIAKRAFEEWTMGYSTIAPSDVQELAGLNDFFDKGTCFEQLDSGRAKKLLGAFAAGRWRGRLGGAKTVAPEP